MKQGHDTVFIVGYFGYFLVGVGSFMFHTTLKYPWRKDPPKTHIPYTHVVFRPRSDQPELYET